MSWLRWRRGPSAVERIEEYTVRPEPLRLVAIKGSDGSTIGWMRAS